MILGLLSRAVLMSTPLLYGAISEVYAERSGMMVTAIEGIFLIGAWAGFTGAYLTGSLAIGLIWAVLGGLLLATCPRRAPARGSGAGHQGRSC